MKAMEIISYKSTLSDNFEIEDSFKKIKKVEKCINLGY
jgi:hypothetical protein